MVQTAQLAPDFSQWDFRAGSKKRRSVPLPEIIELRHNRGMVGTTQNVTILGRYFGPTPLLSVVKVGSFGLV